MTLHHRSPAPAFDQLPLGVAPGPLNALRVALGDGIDEILGVIDHEVREPPVGKSTVCLPTVRVDDGARRACLLDEG